jgi:hypothetical protein
MNNALEKLFDTVIRAARDLGCECPVLEECTDDTVCVVDTVDGKTYKIELKEF